MSKKLRKSQRRSLRDRISKLRRSPDSGDRKLADELAKKFKERTR